ncbi:MAG: hypothetical protein AB7L71_15575 [Vicinamibacterales bacterium]
MTAVEVSASIGLLGSGWACWIQLKALDAYDYVSICDVSTSLACAEPLLGRAGFMLGISLPQVALFFCALLVALSLAGDNLKCHRAATAIGILGVAVGARVITSPLMEASTLCLACVASGLPLVVASMLTLVRLTGTGPMPRRRGWQVALRSDRTSMAFFLVLGTVGMAVSIQRFPNPAEISYNADIEVLSPNASGDDEELPVLTARVFVDYNRCQTCSNVVGDAEEAARQVFLDRGIQINVEIADFPLDASCNRSASVATDSKGCLAAAAVRFMGSFGLASQLRAWLFKSGGNWTVQELLEQVHSASRRKDFQANYDISLRDKLAADVTAASDLGVRTVPTIELSGRLLRGVHPIASVRRFLEGGLMSTVGVRHRQ